MRKTIFKINSKKRIVKAYTVAVAALAVIGTVIGIATDGFQLKEHFTGWSKKPENKPLYEYDSKNFYNFRDVNIPVAEDIKEDLSKEGYDNLIKYIATKNLKYLNDAIEDEKKHCIMLSVLRSLKGKHFFDRGDINNAIEEFEEAYRLDPQNINLLWLYLQALEDVCFDSIRENGYNRTPEFEKEYKKTQKHTKRIIELKKIIDSYVDQFSYFDRETLDDPAVLLAHRSQKSYPIESVAYKHISLINSFDSQFQPLDGLDSIYYDDIPLSENSLLYEYQPHQENLVRYDLQKPLSLARSSGVDFQLNPRVRHTAALLLESGWNYIINKIDAIGTHEKDLAVLSGAKLLAVGIDSYGHNSAVDSLDYAVSDANRVAKEFKALGYKPKTLLDSQATKFNIVESLIYESMLSKSTDTLVLYFAGHGFSDQDENKFLLTHSNVAGENDALSLSEIEAFLSDHKGKTYVIADACFNQLELGTGADNQSRVPDQAGRMSAKNRTTFLLASAEGGKAIESHTLKSGVATHFLLEYIKQPYNHNRRRQSFEDLDKMWKYVSQKTPILAKEKHGINQMASYHLGVPMPNRKTP